MDELLNYYTSVNYDSDEYRHVASQIHSWLNTLKQGDVHNNEDTESTGSDVSSRTFVQL